MKKLLLVAGARPNFMKIAPIIRAINAHPLGKLEYKLIHTGQHYDNAMSDVFFQELGIPKPEYNLEVGSSSHAVQTGEIMVRFEKVCLDEKPDCVVVVGDVNSTVACGLVAKKLHIELAHVEAGLRSGDRTMPEEINRLATDAITDHFFVTEPHGMKNLLAEGHPRDQVHFVGHVMIDNLFYQLERLSDKTAPVGTRLKSRLPKKYLAMTMHRPSNVDNKETLEKFLKALAEIAEKAPIVFPVHPRTKANIEKFGLGEYVNECMGRWVDEKNEKSTHPRIYAVPPLGYMDFLSIWKDATCVITDSGGLQEETTALKIPCITIRETTERPVTADVGSNAVVGQDVEKMKELALGALEGEWKSSLVPELWDGNASMRIAEILAG